MLKKLDWENIIECTEKHARSLPARQIVQSWKNIDNWSQSQHDAQRRQTQTGLIVPLLSRTPLWNSLLELDDPFEAIDSLSKKRVLGLEQLVLVRKWLLSFEVWTEVATLGEVKGELSSDLSRMMNPLLILREVNKWIGDDGDVLESASPELKSVNTKIAELESEIGKKVATLRVDLHEAGILQDAISDFRDGHYVLPVKASHRSKLDGVVYGFSASRQTMYVEPQEVEILNIQIREFRIKRAELIYKILLNLSDSLSNYVDDLLVSARILIMWDAIAARARYSLGVGGKLITVYDSNRIELYDTANPNLWFSMSRSEIVLNTVLMTDESRTILISGPNAGGKTVILKTIGIAAAFARTGFWMPGTREHSVPYFQKISILIGDYQSVQENASSFSGYIKRLIQVLGFHSQRSLVLLDELNSATDPVEGAALSQAVLEELCRINAATGSVTIATTHDPNLKLIGVDRSDIINAAMEYDEINNRASYKMTMGIPGRSRALEVARSLGMNSSILLRAKELLSGESQRIEAILEKLEKDRADAAALKRQVEIELEDAKKLKQKWNEKATLTVEMLGEKSLMSMKSLYKIAEAEIKSRMQDLVKVRKPHELEGFREEVSNLLGDAQKGIDQAIKEELPGFSKNREKRQVAPNLAVGDWIRIRKYKSTGQITAVKGQKIKLLLGVPGKGITSPIEMEVSFDEAEKLETQPKPSKTKIEVSSRVDTKNIGSELDVRGNRLDEALDEVRFYLDHAFVKRMPMVRIIHGLGTGALREGIRRLLKEMTIVSRFKDAEPSNGGTGATDVWFDY